MTRRAVIIDSHHPKHYLTMRRLGRRCLAQGIEVVWTAREKDVLVDLIRGDGFEPVVLTRGRRTLPGKLRELAAYDWRLLRLARRVRPMAMIGKAVTLTHVGRALGIPGILINDDSAAANPQFRWLGYPFAHRILTSECLDEEYGPRQRRYPGLMELAYLHPAAFSPDPAVRGELGLGDGERLFVLRLAAHDAYHDVWQHGLGATLTGPLIERLERAGRLVIVSEAPLPPELVRFRYPLAANRLHHVLAAADLVVGDGLTTCVEAALLGTPAVAVGTLWGKHAYARTLEERFGLLVIREPADPARLLHEIGAMLSSPDLKRTWAERRARMLEDWGDPTDVYWEELMRAAPAVGPVAATAAA